MPEISNEVKEQVIGEMLKSASGRQKLAASMVQPLRTRRDYNSVARKTFMVEQLPDGALPVYDKDPEVTAYVIGEEGDAIQAVAKSRRVIFPLFVISAHPSVALTQVKERRFDIIERAQDLGKVAIQVEEDTRAFQVCDAIATSGFDDLVGGTNADLSVSAPLTPSSLYDAFSLIERHDLRVARIFMNARDFTDIRKWGRDVFDIETQANLLKAGILANIGGAQIIISRLVPTGTMYICTDPEYFGRIPVRSELTVLSADNPTALTIGFSMFEQIGLGAFNPRGLVRINITRS